jgi:hypothetical protein
MRKALEVERHINANEFGILTEDFHRVIPKLQANMAVYKFVQLHPGAPPEQWPGRLSWVFASDNLISLFVTRALAAQEACATN